jgi:hypothetical protein
VPEKDRNKLFANEIKLELLLKEEYSKFLEETYMSTRPLRDDFDEYTTGIIEDLKNKYLCE